MPTTIAVSIAFFGVPSLKPNITNFEYFLKSIFCIWFGLNHSISFRKSGPNCFITDGPSDSVVRFKIALVRNLLNDKFMTRDCKLQNATASCISSFNFVSVN